MREFPMPWWLLVVALPPTLFGAASIPIAIAQAFGAGTAWWWCAVAFALCGSVQPIARIVGGR